MSRDRGQPGGENRGARDHRAIHPRGKRQPCFACADTPQLDRRDLSSMCVLIAHRSQLSEPRRSLG
jgi:hypothetical protein